MKIEINEIMQQDAAKPAHPRYDDAPNERITPFFKPHYDILENGKKEQII